MNAENTKKLFDRFPDFFTPKVAWNEYCYGWRLWFRKQNLTHQWGGKPTWNPVKAIWHDIRQVTKNIWSWTQPRRPRSLQQSLMGFGFDCGDGWFDLIWRLCEDIEKLGPPKGFEVVQVKEKFGELRFYANGSTDAIEDRIDQATGESVKTCETCGAPGELQTGGWYFTACPVHIER